MAFAATGRDESTRLLRAAMERAARENTPNGDMTRVAGFEAAEGMLAFGAGDYARAAEKLLAVRDVASRFGGSHAQRDVLTLTLIEAARRSGQRSLATSIVNERLVQKPASPWGRRIAERIAGGARASTLVAA